jgi:uncharacterized protein YdaU (DUF1376 family)
MHYYKFDISAWALHTAHLNPTEESIYLRLINFYYDTEKHIPLDLPPVLRRLRLNEFADIADSILLEFFICTDDGWSHNRCNLELKQYLNRKVKNIEVGKLGGRPKKTQSVSKINHEGSENNPNYKLLTNNYKLQTNKKHIAPPDGVASNIWVDFLTLRKSKKMPVTETALKGLQREADKAGVNLQTALQTCCERGWGGFKADWLKDKQMLTEVKNKNLAAARAIFGDERGLNEKTIAITD